MPCLREGPPEKDCGTLHNSPGTGLTQRGGDRRLLTADVFALLQQALAAWPTLMASGLRLGSPAVSIAQDGTRRDSWLGQFMQQVRCLALAPPDSLGQVVAYT